MTNQKQKVVLYPPTIDWNFLRQRPQQLCSQFARNGYKVIYCNNTQNNNPPVEIEKNLFVHSNFNQVLQDIKSGKLKIDIFYNTWAKQTQYIDIIKPKLTIFDNVDLFSEWAIYEAEAVKKADIVLCTSQLIYDLREKQHENVHLVRNGCASELLEDNHIIPKDISNFNKPCGVVGALGSWVLTSLMKKVAEKYPTVFIGKEFPKECPSNVINLGLKDHSELINYYNALSVGLIPFNTKLELIQACCPVKLFEYLACGLPVVATSWHETEIYGDVVLTSSSPDEFMRNVEKAIEFSKDPNFSKKAKKVASENTWEVRFQQIDKAIQQFYNSKVGALT